MSKITVTIQPYSIKVCVDSDKTIFEILQEVGISIKSVCGGYGNCGKCKVVITNGEYIYDEIVREFLTNEELKRGYTLACVTKCLTDCEIYIPSESRLGIQKILQDAVIPEIELNPIVSCINGEIIDKITGKVIDHLDSSQVYGLAIDVGTTKVVTYLVDLNTGRIVNKLSDYNRQVVLGEDLMSRIEHARRDVKGTEKLQKLVIETINSLVNEHLEKIKISSRQIVYACIASNTVMTYLLLGKNPTPLASPNIEIERDSIIIKANELGININNNAHVYVTPCVSRFLGGDVLCDILISNMWRDDKLSLLIDIGTNTHVVLGCSEWFIACTGPGGTAFEGWSVRFGMRAIEGAIDSLKIDKNTYKAKYTVIGNSKPKGLCGSGLIDLLAELYIHGIVDFRGKFSEEMIGKVTYLRKRDHDYEYIVVPRDETELDIDITINQKDINNLLDSKASVCASITTLLKKMRISINDIERVYICGAFANYINLNNAIKIGLFPEFPNAEFTLLGNGSIAGTYTILVHYKYRDVVEKIAREMTYIELVQDQDFVEEYEAALSIPGRREYFPTMMSY